MKKISTTKIHIIIAIFVIATIIPGSLFFLAPTYLTAFRYVSYLFSLLAILFIITPFGNQRISGNSSSFSTWLLKIIAAECALGLLFFSVMHTALTYISLPPTLNENMTVRNLTYDLLLHAGFHPWPLVAVFSLGLAHLLFNEKKIAIFSTFFPNFYFIHDEGQHFLKRTIQVIVNLAIYVCITITLSIGALQVTALLSNAVDMTRVNSMNFITLSFAMIALILLFSQLSKHVIKILCQKKLPVGGFLLIFSLILSVFLFAMNIITPFIEPLFTAFQTIQLPTLTMTKSIWQITAWAWWVGFVPLISSFIACISQGRSFREVIMAVSFFPLVCTLMFYYLPINFADTAIGLDWLALSGPLIVILLFVQSHDSRILSLGLIPHQKGNIYAAPRRTIKFIHSFLQAVLLMAFIYLWLGMVGICLFIVMATFCCFLLFTAATWFFCRRIIFLKTKRD